MKKRPANLKLRLNNGLTAVVSMLAGGLIAMILASCGSSFSAKSNSSAGSDQASRKDSQTLVPNTSDSSSTPSVYTPTFATITVDHVAHTIRADVVVNSKAGDESVKIAGKIDPSNNSATLQDLHPLSGGRQRVVGEALCADGADCKYVILNVYYKVGSQTPMKQFVSDQLFTQQATAGDDDEDSTRIPPSEAGEFVGAPRNEIVIGKLWDRPADPTQAASDEKAGAQDSSGDSTQNATVPSADTPAASTSPPASAPQKPASPTAQKPATSQPAPKTPTAPAAPAAPVTKPSAGGKGQAPPQTPPAVSSGTTNPVPSQSAAPDAPSSSGDDETPIPDAPSTADVDQKLASLEKKVAPLLDVSGGGRALGCYAPMKDVAHPENNCAGGHLVNATSLPATATGFKMLWPTQGVTYATGMMASLIENIAQLFNTQTFPGFTVVVGNVAMKNGGSLAGAGHVSGSHQNGLDADIFYFGLKKPGYDSGVLAGNKINPDLDFEKNFEFLRQVASQQIIQDGKKRTVLNRVFMYTAVKKAFCEWAVKNGKLSDPLNVDILHRISPTVPTPGSTADTGHKKHFHMRLVCSPHYPGCRNQNDPPGTDTGCAGVTVRDVPPVDVSTDAQMSATD